MLGANYKKPGGLPQTTSLSRVSVFSVGGAYQDYQDHGWGSFSEVEDNEEKNHSSFSIEMLTVYAMKPKMFSLMRWRIRNYHSCYGKSPKSLEEAFKIAERMELYARKVKPEDKDGFESKLKDLVTCSSFIVTLNQDCYN